MLYIYFSILENEREQINLADLYNENKNILFNFALSMTKDIEMSEDAIHDTFLSVIKHKEKIFKLSKKEQRSYLIIMTKNKCIDLIRKNNYKSTKPIELFEYNLKSEEIPIDNQLILIEEYNNIKKYIESLDEMSKLILEMKYILGMTYREIGNELNITAKHVDTKIMRAKEKVRKLILSGGISDDKK